MAHPPYVFKGYDPNGKRQSGQHAEPDLPAWVRARFEEGWTDLDVMFTPRDGSNEPMLCGAIYRRRVTSHPKARTVRAWIADGTDGWRRSGE